MKMQTIMVGNGEMVRETIRTMLQVNTEMRTRLQPNADAPDSGDGLPEVDAAATQEEPQIGTGNGKGNGQQTDQLQTGQFGKNIALAGEFLENDELRLTFSGEGVEGQAYYLEIGGNRQDCTVGQGVITCTMNRIMQQGIANLYDKATNTLLFQYTFDHSSQIQKGTIDDDLGQGNKEGDQDQNRKK